ncbi:MAG: EamA family transporter [Gammaproteobacteria bacterium]|jgi:drug/metabolite transporter (DMT)-like permease|nr:EamA family transporter [Gammaproteobacteria bacterium]MBT4606194.1 EamA family transporter [Thiotrichales bacterium]MBT3472307.1 EamA family transporter [Gammaproteobacteria bacterium]MBT3967854.1 EamA family transporter [Gammaproteobacteria bacterium]MBT4081759.1 EamA family transporter [Gammaproteobacteria bacterium]
MSPLEWGLLVALSILWGGSFFFNGVAIRELPTLTVVAGRVILGAVTLLVVMRVMGLRMPSGRPVWLAFFSMGFLNNVLPFSLIVWGQIHIASGIASILNATTPLFTVIVAHLLTSDEKISKSSLLGIGFGFAGVVMMIGGDAFRGWGVDILAPVAILGAALSYAFAGVFGRRFKAMGVSPMATATGQITASSVMLVPLVMMVDQPWTLPLPSLPVWGALVGLALLSTALAYIIYFRILESAGATNLLLVTFLIPVSAIVLGIGFLGEILLPKQLLGMLLIGMGLVAIDGRIWTLFISQKPPP